MKAILHCDKEWGIGKNNQLMFSIPADMKFFRETTTGKVVVMGANTLLSFPQAKPLKNRVNIVLSSKLPKRDDCTVIATLNELFDKIKGYPPDDVFVIGGAQLYKTLLPYCSEVLVTKVNAVGGADTFFPNLDKEANFTITASSEPLETNGYTIQFVTYQNQNVKQF